MKPFHNSMLVVSLCVAGVAVWQPAHAQSYPAKPIRLIIPYPPGGGVDAIMRPFAQHLSARLGQQIIIDNRGGAGGSIAMETTARATPDGYTIVAAITAQLAINPALYRRLPYDPVKDFAPITWFADGAYILVVHPSLPVKSVQEFVELARKRPNEITYASAGNGSGGHLAGALLSSMTGIKILHVPYKGGGPGQVALLSGEVQAKFEVWASSRGIIQNGRIRALGVATATRRKASPDIPTIAEAGVPGYESGLWYALLATAGTPRAIIDRLNRETIVVLNNPEYIKVLAEQGIEPVGSTPEELTQYIRRELDKWAKVVKETGARID
ncbi:MAG: tripartite tricarboxylate transporter substrate binding protein [Sulfuricaulis sp.]|nr:tripartite tricarboxylate transporter substrate binding protein [Sulfuricaulis sp.]